MLYNETMKTISSLLRIARHPIISYRVMRALLHDLKGLSDTERIARLKILQRYRDEIQLERLYKQEP